MLAAGLTAPVCRRRSIQPWIRRHPGRQQTGPEGECNSGPSAVAVCTAAGPDSRYPAVLTSDLAPSARGSGPARLGALHRHRHGLGPVSDSGMSARAMLGRNVLFVNDLRESYSKVAGPAGSGGIIFEPLPTIGVWMPLLTPAGGTAVADHKTGASSIDGVNGKAGEVPGLHSLNNLTRHQGKRRQCS